MGQLIMASLMELEGLAVACSGACLICINFNLIYQAQDRLQAESSTDAALAMYDRHASISSAPPKQSPVHMEQ
jgi:hypothetical protein